jgi:hypothetical protein
MQQGDFKGNYSWTRGLERSEVGVLQLSVKQGTFIG